MNIIGNYEADKLTRELTSHVDYCRDRVNALNALIQNIDLIYYKNGRCKLERQSSILLGETYYRTFLDERNIVIRCGSDHLVQLGLGYDKQALLNEAIDLLIVLQDRLSKAQSDLDGVGARIAELNALAERLVSECKAVRLQYIERDILLNAIKYQSVQKG